MSNLYGRLMIDIEGLSLSEEDIFVLSNKNVGGLILFSRNYESIEQLQNLISEINDIKKNIIISVDQEGGRVQRFHEDFTTIPSMQSLTSYAVKENDKRIFHDVAWLTSTELKAVGIDLNFAPVLDIDESKSSIIGDRAFSKNVKEVIEFSSLYIDGMHEAGMKSTGKHFPGHGGVYEDSHLELVEDQRSLEDLLHEDIKPYSELKDKLDVIMCAHVLFPEVDKKLPSYSKIWLEDILRDKLQYKGLIFSDDLSMKGSGDKNCSKKTKQALDAGCDMALICNDRHGVLDTINFMDDNNIRQSEKLSILKNNNLLDWRDVQSNERILEIRNKLKSMRS